MNLTFSQIASIVRDGLSLDLFEPISLREWAYVQIERMEKPPHWVLEFATSRQNGYELAKLIDAAETVEPSITCGVLLAMQQMPDDLSESQLLAIIGCTYSLCKIICGINYKHPVLYDAMSLDENYSLMREGYVQYTMEQIRRDAAEYLRKYSLPAEAELLKPLRCRHG